MPLPPTNRAEIQEPFVREQEIDPDGYYPADHRPKLLQDWPVDDDLVVPLEQMPPAMLAGIGDAWRRREAYKKHTSELTADGGRPRSPRIA